MCDILLVGFRCGIVNSVFMTLLPFAFKIVIGEGSLMPTVFNDLSRIQTPSPLIIKPAEFNYLISKIQSRAASIDK